MKSLLDFCLRLDLSVSRFQYCRQVVSEKRVLHFIHKGCEKSKLSAELVDSLRHMLSRISPNNCCF